MIRQARHVIELWQALGLGKVPTRDRFKLSHFPALEAQMFGFEVAERLEDYRVANAGSAAQRSFGGPFLGTSLADLDLGAAKQEVAEEYQLCARKRVAIASRHLMRVGDDGLIGVQRVLLPFDLPAAGGVSHVLGWFHVSPRLHRVTKGSVSKWLTEERLFIAA